MSDIKECVETSGYKAVLYSDGGFHSNERAGGWGVHGYVYDTTEQPKKGSGNPKSTPTAEGYSEGKNETAAVKVINYVDSFGSVVNARSNNQTELLATKNALSYILDKKIPETIIYSDSKYVVEGINKYLPKWKKANFTKSTGEEVSNKSDWMAVDALLNELSQANSEVKLAWIKGHNGNVGNELADKWASKGNCLAINGTDKIYKFEDPADGYWKVTPSQNRMFDQSKWYLSSLSDDRLTSKCGRTIYYLGDHGDDEDVGKPQSDSSNSVIYVKETIPVLDEVRKQVIARDPSQYGRLFVGALRNILNGNVTEDIMRFGLDVFRSNPSNHSLATNNKLPVLFHQTPTGLSFYNIDNLEILRNILDEYLAGDKSIIVTDLTDLLYEVSEKKGVTVRTLRKEISNTVKFLDVAVKYNLSLASELRKMTDVPTKTSKLRLIVGSDIISRNALSALADSVKRVVVLTWRESDSVFRYATVIETEEDIGIWANPFGNFKLVK